MIVWFSSAGRGPAGEFYLFFTSSPQYWLGRCSTSWINFRDLPTETDKVWTITLSRVTGGKRVVITCHDMKNHIVELLDTTCKDKNGESYWSRDVTRIQFSPYDTASDYYGPGDQLKIFYFIYSFRQRYAGIAQSVISKKPANVRMKKLMCVNL